MATYQSPVIITSNGKEVCNFKVQYDPSKLSVNTFRNLTSEWMIAAESFTADSLCDYINNRLPTANCEVVNAIETNLQHA